MKTSFYIVWLKPVPANVSGGWLVHHILQDGDNKFDTKDQALATIRERIKQHPDRKYILQEYYAAE